MEKEETVTKARQACALCEAPIGEENDSKEHIIPNAIGGRRRVQGFLCRACNMMAGEDWDDVLARQLHPISNLLGIKRERGRPPMLVVDTTGGAADQAQKRRSHDNGPLPGLRTPT